MLNWVLDRQTATLWVFIGTLALTVILYVNRPQRVLPAAGHGVIQGISEAPQSISFPAIGRSASRRSPEQSSRIPRWRACLLHRRDGTNTTLNSGRSAHQPETQGAARRYRQRDARAAARLAKVEGIALYMQPVQDLTIEDRVSRTQYQFTLESANPDELSEWVHRMTSALSELPQLADVASDLQDQGLQAYLSIDRDTAGRLGITPAAVDIALYNAFGQRLVSTIFTQSNQYRVVLEGEARVPPRPRRAQGHLRRLVLGCADPVERHHHGH